ncbi:MAG: DNA cytosine methyltransferase [Oscillospiraceae bacterium]|nr:DNA cytosine methyltransferase [Oscillospiraceae bacterium]
MPETQNNLIKRTMIDLFAGAGGLSCGLEQAGFTPVLANEMVRQFACTYQVNHPETRVVVKDVRDVDEKALHSLVENYGEIEYCE